MNDNGNSPLIMDGTACGRPGECRYKGRWMSRTDLPSAMLEHGELKRYISLGLISPREAGIPVSGFGGNQPYSMGR